MSPGAPQKASGRAALFRDGGAQPDRPQLHDPPPAAPAHDRREEDTARFPTMPARTCFCRSANAPTRTRRCASPSSASRRSAPTGISPRIFRSARAAPTSASSTTSSSTCAASPARPAARAALTSIEGQRTGRVDRGGRLAPHQHAEPQSSGPRRPRRTTAPRRCARRSSCSPTFPTARPSAKIRGVRSLDRAPGRAAAAASRRARRPRAGSRSPSSWKARRSRARALFCWAPSSTASSPNMSRSTISPRRSSAPSSGARSCAGRRASASGASCDLPLGACSRAVALRSPRRSCGGSSARTRASRASAKRAGSRDEFVEISAGSVSRIPRLEPRSCGVDRGRRSRTPQGPFPRHVRPAGRAAADDDRGGVWLAS